MILVDTSVWVEHLRRGLPRLAMLLQELLLIEREQLMGRGIGYVDPHLLASTKLSYTKLWTQDRRLAALAQERGLALPEAEEASDTE